MRWSHCLPVLLCFMSCLPVLVRIFMYMFVSPCPTALLGQSVPRDVTCACMRCKRSSEHRVLTHFKIEPLTTCLKHLLLSKCNLGRHYRETRLLTNFNMQPHDGIFEKQHNIFRQDLLPLRASSLHVAVRALVHQSAPHSTALLTTIGFH